LYKVLANMWCLSVCNKRDSQTDQ